MPLPFWLVEAESHVARWIGEPVDSIDFQKSTWHRLIGGPKGNGLPLFEGLFELFEKRRGAAHREQPPSSHNWRFRRKPNYADNNKSLETRLEKDLVKQEGSEWFNALPTASGIFGSSSGKKSNIDLAIRRGGHHTFVELKCGSDSVVYAAIQLAGYATAWVQARKNAKVMGYQIKETLRPALDTVATRWVVAAPEEQFNEVKVGTVVADVEQNLNAGIAAFFRQQFNSAITADFRFVRLPAGYEKSPLPPGYAKTFADLLFGKPA